jgi:hypothetical protein
MSGNGAILHIRSLCSLLTWVLLLTSQKDSRGMVHTRLTLYTSCIHSHVKESSHDHSMSGS